MITIRAADDWLVFGQNESGDWFYVSTEVWPEWLDAPRAPEDMEANEAYAWMLKFARARQRTAMIRGADLNWYPIPGVTDDLDNLATKFKSLLIQEQ